MVDRFDQEERYGPDLTIVKRARFNQTNEPYRTNDVPAKPGVEPHSKVKELPALPVRELQQDNMLQHQDHMLQDEEVVNFGQQVQQPQHHQQQLQLQQHNIPHNPVCPKQVMSPNRMWKHRTWVVHLVQMHYTSRTIWYSRLFIWNGIRN